MPQLVTFLVIDPVAVQKVLLLLWGCFHIVLLLCPDYLLLPVHIDYMLVQLLIEGFLFDLKYMEKLQEGDQKLLIIPIHTLHISEDVAQVDWFLPP